MKRIEKPKTRVRMKFNTGTKVHTSKVKYGKKDRKGNKVRI